MSILWTKSCLIPWMQFSAISARNYKNYAKNWMCVWKEQISNNIIVTILSLSSHSVCPDALNSSASVYLFLQISNTATEQISNTIANSRAVTGVTSRDCRSVHFGAFLEKLAIQKHAPHSDSRLCLTDENSWRNIFSISWNAQCDSWSVVSCFMSSRNVFLYTFCV